MTTSCLAKFTQGVMLSYVATLPPSFVCNLLTFKKIILINTRLKKKKTKTAYISKIHTLNNIYYAKLNKQINKQEKIVKEKKYTDNRQKNP